MPRRRGICISCQRENLIIMARSLCSTCWRREHGYYWHKGKYKKISVTKLSQLIEKKAKVEAASKQYRKLIKEVGGD